jgi:hypothetical protein
MVYTGDSEQRAAAWFSETHKDAWCGEFKPKER